MRVIWICLLLALIPISGFSMLKKKIVEPEAGDPLRTHEVILGEPYQSILFGGVRFSHSTGSFVSLGVGSSVNGSNVYLFNYTDIGRYGSFSSEAAYLFNPVARLYVGPLAGPNVDWLGESARTDPIAYLTGAAGVVVGYNISGNWGIWGYGKYTFSFAGETQHQDGYLVGFGLYCGW